MSGQTMLDNAPDSGSLCHCVGGDWSGDSCTLGSTNQSNNITLVYILPSSVKASASLTTVFFVSIIIIGTGKNSKLVLIWNIFWAIRIQHKFSLVKYLPMSSYQYNTGHNHNFHS